MIRDPNKPKFCALCEYCPNENYDNIRSDYKGWCSIASKGVYDNQKGCIKGKLI